MLVYVIVLVIVIVVVLSSVDGDCDVGTFDYGARRRCPRRV